MMSTINEDVARMKFGPLMAWRSTGCFMRINCHPQIAVSFLNKATGECSRIRLTHDAARRLSSTLLVELQRYDRTTAHSAKSDETPRVCPSSGKTEVE